MGSVVLFTITGSAVLSDTVSRQHRRGIFISAAEFRPGLAGGSTAS